MPTLANPVRPHHRILHHVLITDFASPTFYHRFQWSKEKKSQTRSITITPMRSKIKTLVKPYRSNKNQLYRNTTYINCLDWFSLTVLLLGSCYFPYLSLRNCWSSFQLKVLHLFQLIDIAYPHWNSPIEIHFAGCPARNWKLTAFLSTYWNKMLRSL